MVDSNFDETKASLRVESGRLYSDGYEIFLDPEISDLVIAVNMHPAAYTESSCQGHFGTFLKGYRAILNIDGNQLRLHRDGVPFEEMYPNVDVQELEFFYDRGGIGIVTRDDKVGQRLTHVLEEWVMARKERVFMEKNDYSTSNRKMYVTFSPQHSLWVRDTSREYPVSRIRTYSFDEILQLNAGRLKTITELERLFAES